MKALVKKEKAPEKLPEKLPGKIPEPIPQLGLSDALVMAAGEEKTELDKVFELLLDPKNIGHNTELSRNEILAFSILGTLANRHNLPVLKEFLVENLVLRVSKSRAGRKEWIKIVGRHLAQENAEAQAENVRRGWFGRRRP